MQSSRKGLETLHGWASGEERKRHVRMLTHAGAETSKCQTAPKGDVGRQHEKTSVAGGKTEREGRKGGKGGNVQKKWG